MIEEALSILSRPGLPWGAQSTGRSWEPRSLGAPVGSEGPRTTTSWGSAPRERPRGHSALRTLRARLWGPQMAPAGKRARENPESAVTSLAIRSSLATFWPLHSLGSFPARVPVLPLVIEFLPWRLLTLRMLLSVWN